MATAYNTNSGIHQLPSSCYPASESDDEDSFVVLNNSLGPDGHMDHAILNTEPILTHTIQASLDSIADILTQQTLQNKDSGNLTTVDSSHISYQSADISADEIQNKVDNLIAENSKLKDTLAQNNIAMKKQVDTIMQWQAEVQRVQESHKEKFNDMKKYITILKAENENLKGLVQKFENKTIDDNTKKTEEILIKQTDNIKQFELEASQKKIKELEKALDIFSLERESLSKQVSAKQVELENVIADKKLLVYELDLSKKKEIELNATATETQSLKNEIVELQDANNNLADEISKLQNQNEKLKLDLAEREEKLTKAQALLCDYEQDLSQKKQQLMVSQMHITELKESHAKDVSLKDKEIITLLGNIKTLQINVDEIAALRTQLELYKNDFEMEREQREELLAEKNKIADDLQQLQRRNNQLLEEVDQLRSGFVPVKREEVRPSTATEKMPGKRLNSKAQELVLNALAYFEREKENGGPLLPLSAVYESPPLQRQLCPICSRKFASLHMLQDHIDYCLANSNT